MILREAERRACLDLAAKIRVAVALNPSLRLEMTRDEALALVHLIEETDRTLGRALALVEDATRASARALAAAEMYLADPGPGGDAPAPDPFPAAAGEPAGTPRSPTRVGETSPAFSICTGAASSACRRVPGHGAVRPPAGADPALLLPAGSAFHPHRQRGGFQGGV